MPISEMTGFLSDHPTMVMAIIIGSLFGAVPILFFISLYKRASAETGMLEKGWLGEAAILQSWNTGASSGTSQFMGMNLEVRPPNGPAYEARIEETIVPMIYIPKLRAGAVVPVRIAREDPKLVSLDLERLANIPPAN